MPTMNPAAPPAPAQAPSLVALENPGVAAALVNGRLIEMGQITTLDSDGATTNYNIALVIEFTNVADIRKAIHDGRCCFSWEENLK